MAAGKVFRVAMVGLPPMPNLSPGQITTLLEPGRTVGTFIDEQLVGTADAATSDLTLPGGAIVRHAAVTRIGVLPTFRRQGIATELMSHQLRDFAARGETVATLRASEATIYERFGYGVASSAQSVEIQTARATLRPGVGTGGPVRLLDTADSWDVLAGSTRGIGRRDREPLTARGFGGSSSDCAPKHRRGLRISQSTASRGGRRDSSATAPSTPRSGSSPTNTPSWSRTSSRRPVRPILDCCVSCSDSI